MVGLVCNIIRMFFSQLHMEEEYTENVVTGWYYQFAFIGNFLLTLASIYSFIRYRKYFPLPINVCYVLLILLIAIASFEDYAEFIKTPSLFYSFKGIGTWINFGVLYFIAEEYYANKIMKWFKFLCYISIIFNLVEIAMLGTINSRYDALFAIRNTTVYLIWVYPFFFLDNSDKTNIAKVAKYGLIALIAFFAFFIASRSYMLIAIFYILIKVRRDLNEKKNALFFTFLLGVLILGSYFLVAHLEDFSSTKTMLSIFSDRIGEDTRTNQLREFMDQFDWSKLFTGQGVTAKWQWSGYRQGYYDSLDNQFILIAWLFGIQTCIVYIFYLVYNFFKKNSINNLKITNAKIIVFFWILACGGFSIYVTISTQMFYYFITFLIGMITLNRNYFKLTLPETKEIISIPST